MNNKDFLKVISSRLRKTKDVLFKKNKEYASDIDNLHNFKRAAQLQGCTPEKALVGMWTKHIVSIMDIVEFIEHYKDFAMPLGELDKKDAEIIPRMDEKIGDAIIYLILLEALIRERYGELDVQIRNADGP